MLAFKIRAPGEQNSSFAVVKNLKCIQPVKSLKPLIIQKSYEQSRIIPQLNNLNF